jgi:hypothetical protein
MSECGCIYEGVDDGVYVLVDSPNHDAEIDMTCGECDGWIPEGTDFELHVTDYEGDLKVYVTCHDCVSLRSKFFCDGWFYGRIWSRFKDHVNELDGQISAECLLSLTEGAREKAFEIIQARFDYLNEQEED